MKTLGKLVDKNESECESVSEWIDLAINPIEILNRDKDQMETALYLTQFTRRSPMGVMINEIGGILIDNGFMKT